VIPYARQTISSDDIRAVVDVLHSDLITQGPTVPRFERSVAEQCRANHAVAVNSATSALHIACLALDVRSGDCVWTVPNTFVASANCARYCGADVDFVDIEPGTWNLSVSALAEKLEAAAARNALPKVVIPVAFSGQSCAMREIRELADRFGFRIIEDASHAIGGTYRGEPVGNGAYADITVFSFHATKIVTTAEGGVATTADAQLAARMRALRTHGVTRDTSDMESESHGAWYYEMLALGWNYRMTELQAALGCSQMERLSQFVASRRALADRYDRLLAGSELALPRRDPLVQSAWHLYVIGWNEEAFGKSRRTAFDALRAAGIGVNVHYIPVHLQPYYRRLGFSPGQFPVAERYYSRALTLPLYATMTESDQDRVVEALLEIARR
jgi:UDP-4-amino-4,6-dideoxy-N-acetyl-beta-L-altrosamine transaminase